jgi:hypothetical protein
MSNDKLAKQNATFIALMQHIDDTMIGLANRDRAKNLAGALIEDIRQLTQANTMLQQMVDAMSQHTNKNDDDSVFETNGPNVAPDATKRQ